MSPELTLNVDGRKHGGWKAIRVTRSLEELAHSFEQELTHRWPDQTEPIPVAAGSKCSLQIDGELVVTGNIDTATPEYDAESHSLIVSGRSKTGDLVDCSDYVTTDFKGRNFLQVAQAVCKPFGISVSTDVDVGAPFAHSQKMEIGETVFTFLERLARYRALRMMSTPAGDLLVTRTSKQRINTPLKLGYNIKSASGNFSLIERFSDYRVYGQQTREDSWSSEAAAEPFGSARDAQMKRYRPMTILADGNINIDECKRQARWQMNTRYGRSQGIVYTVLGWRDDDGALWQPNRMVPVIDAFARIEKELLITTVVFILDESGQRTEIQVMPAEAFDDVALPEATGEEENTWLNINAGAA